MTGSLVVVQSVQKLCIFALSLLIKHQHTYMSKISLTPISRVGKQ